MNRAAGNHGRTVRLPIHLLTAISKLTRARHELFQKLGREPDVHELVQQMGIPRARVRAMLLAAMESVSMETPISHEHDGCLGDLIEDTRAVSPLDAAISTTLIEHARGAFAILSPREEKILRLRFGIDYEPDHTLYEVGRGMGLSRERIRQIEAGALSRLRRSFGARMLVNYVKE